MPFLIDSNILIDVSRGNAGAIKYVDRLAEPWAVSQVTAMELIVGARDKRDLATIDGFLSLCPVVPLSDSIGTGTYRLLKTYAKSHGLHVFDSLIAATAMDKALTLVRPIPGRFRASISPNCGRTRLPFTLNTTKN
jgi:predicted nucleic acid-binding protein